MWWRTTATLAIRTHKGGARMSDGEHGVLSTRGYRPVILFVVSRVSPRGGSPPRRVRPCGRHRIRADAAMSVGSGEGGQQDKCRGRRPGVAAPSGTAKHGVLEPSSSVSGVGFVLSGLVRSMMYGRREARVFSVVTITGWTVRKNRGIARDCGHGYLGVRVRSRP